MYFYEEPVFIHLGSWVSLGNLDINYGILLDSLSMSVMVPVGIVTLCVLFYAVDYMAHDPNRNRFYIILSVFAIFMTVLVVSENYLMMFIGWEFVGVVSYLLISFWNTRIAAMKSALSAILLNRMGDTFFVICLGCMITYFNALDFETIELLTPHVDTLILNLLVLMLLIAATAKSAQLGLHGWLLSAMEGHRRWKAWYIKNSNRKINKRNLSSKNEDYKNRSPLNYDKIWVYDVNTLKLVNNKPFNSKSECSRELNITRNSIAKYIETDNILKYKYIFRYNKMEEKDLLKFKLISDKTLEVITGELLGDGHISSGDNSYRLQFTFASNILDYVNHLKFNVLKEVCNDSKPTPYPKENPKQYWFASKAMPLFKDLHSQWYKINNNINYKNRDKFIKVLPKNIYDLLTPISIAHWLMGDGYYNTKEECIYFCTDNFTKDEVLLLIDILDKKFKIKSNISNRNYLDKDNNQINHFRIRLPKDSTLKLIKLVKRYIIPIMKYKLGI